MEIYDTIFKQVEPKRRALDVAEKQLTAAYKELQVKKNQLKEVQDLLNDLTTQFQVVNEKKLKLQHQVDECTERLDRAEKLINGLSSEKERWAEKAVNLGVQAQNVVGDILVSSGIVAYLGIFTAEYRENCTVEWIQLMKEKGIPIGDDYSLAKVLGNDVQIQQWHLQALPKDSFSITNELMMKNGLHWPLVIDTQEQANTWIKKM
jgi:dynein heavy chain